LLQRKKKHIYTPRHKQKKHTTTTYSLMSTTGWIRYTLLDMDKVIRRGQKRSFSDDRSILHVSPPPPTQAIQPTQRPTIITQSKRFQFYSPTSSKWK
jgi:hypothetical protein